MSSVSDIPIVPAEEATDTPKEKSWLQHLHSGLSQVVMVYDEASEQRVRQLAPHLAQLVRGGAAIVLSHL